MNKVGRLIDANLLQSKAEDFQLLGDFVHEYRSFEGMAATNRILERFENLVGAFYTQKEDEMADAAMESLRALEEDREPGQKKEPHTHESGARLIEYLRKAETYRKDVYRGIKESEHVWRFVVSKMGKEWYDERFRREYSEKKYSHNFKPRAAEYRYMSRNKPIKSRSE